VLSYLADRLRALISGNQIQCAFDLPPEGLGSDRLMRGSAAGVVEVWKEIRDL
jgi:hypothetical protein